MRKKQTMMDLDNFVVEKEASIKNLKGKKESVTESKESK
jgi:hypothetical protein